VHVTTYLTDRDDFDAFNEIFKQTFSHPYPARATVLAQLIVPDLSIEVTAVAALPR
jgi:enamine deaminase RidA (YjgF/YER057c/UK114 family)